MILFFDTETTGVIPRGLEHSPLNYAQRYTRIVQLSWQVRDGEKVKEGDFIIKPDGFTIPDEAAAVHGITTERAIAEGVEYKTAFLQFFNDLKNADEICAHNANFDQGVLIAEYVRITDRARAAKFAMFIKNITLHDTMILTKDFVGARFSNGKPGKFPRLEELYAKLFNGESFPAHNSMEDVRALAKCYFECRKRLIF